MLHACFQLLIDSDIALPELPACSAPHALGDADVHIGLASLPADGRHIGQQKGPFLWMGPGVVWLEVPGVARFQVEQGRRITVSPAPGIDEDSVRLFLLGTALGALLAQRGLVVLQGNAVLVGGQGLVCVGPSGVGKSTLAAALMQRGHAPLADGLVAIDATGRVLPGLPRIKLWQDAADRLSVVAAGLGRTRPGFHSFHLPVPEPANAAPVVLRWFYLLDTHARNEVSIAPVRGMECFKGLQRHLYRARMQVAMAPKPEHLALFSHLDKRARVAQVDRPDEGFALDRLVDALLTDVAAHP